MNQNWSNVWKILNNLKRVKTPSTTSLNRQRMNNLQFGEELPNHIVYETNVQRAPMKAAKFSEVRALADQITLKFYKEPKYGQFIMGIYGDYVRARVDMGFTGGLRGMNKKGIICAILFIIVLYENRAKLDLKRLISVANSIKSSSKVKVTDRMVYKYMNEITNALRAYRNRSNSSNNNESIYRSITEDIYRIAYRLGYTRKEAMPMIKSLRKIPVTTLENYKNESVATCIIYIHQKQNKPMDKQKMVLSKYVQNNVLPTIASELLLSLSVNVSVKR